MRDLVQSLEINENRFKASNAQTTANYNAQHIKVLSDKLDRVSLMVVASLELLEELGVSETRIAKKIEEIDLRDGSKDGKVTPPSNCAECGNKVSHKRTSCFFCGTPIPTI